MKMNILDYLEETGGLFPDKIALADEKKSVTFNALIDQSKRIATDLSIKTNGIKNNPVIVLVDRDVESVIAFMAVIYSGNFYVPVDAKTPSYRLSLIVENLNAKTIITIKTADSQLLKDAQFQGSEIKFCDSVNSSIDHEVLQAIRRKVIDIDPIYAIFTSGSTGIPKGVLISHKSVIDLTEWLVGTFRFSEEDRLGNQTPFYFDGSVKDIYIMLKTGATLHILAKKFFSFPKLLANYLNNHKITTLLWATSAVTLIGNSNILQENNFYFVNKVFFAGEAMPGKQLNVWRSFLPHAQYINLYGPTEATVDATYYIVDRSFNDDEFIPIGIPCQNKEVMVLDENNNFVQAGEEGELCIRGTGLALGYFNNKEKTSEVFVQNPMHNNYVDLIYKTGDIVKYNKYNELVFVNRKDFQIKHMGNRIELGEIEVAVNAIPKVNSAACIYDQNEQKIILFYTTDLSTEIDIINLLKNKIPKYMFPNKVIRFEKLPYNSNGKIDRIVLKEYYYNGIIN